MVGPSPTLRQYQEAKCKAYADLLESKAKWFDFVWITAADADQKQHFEATVSAMLAQNRIPSSPHYDVIPDPSAAKVGCGGSTMFALREMARKYGRERILASKVCLIHAGGHSKRIPNHSAYGKIFSTVPMQMPTGHACSMLELKFIMFVDFPALMAPGVWLTCSDDIVFFDSNMCDFTRKGFTALGHPSSLTIGTGHGVFVLDPAPDAPQGLVRECAQFLHKPSVEAMRAAGAVFRGRAADGTEEQVPPTPSSSSP